jgi:hypothetical protein
MDESALDQATITGLHREVNRHLDFLIASKGALADAGLEFGNDYLTVAEGIRILAHHRDSLVHELRRIKGIVDGAIPK